MSLPLNPERPPPYALSVFISTYMSSSVSLPRTENKLPSLGVTIESTLTRINTSRYYDNLSRFEDHLIISLYILEKESETNMGMNYASTTHLNNIFW